MVAELISGKIDIGEDVRGLILDAMPKKKCRRAKKTVGVGRWKKTIEVGPCLNPHELAVNKACRGAISNFEGFVRALEDVSDGERALEFRMSHELYKNSGKAECRDKNGAIKKGYVPVIYNDTYVCAPIKDSVHPTCAYKDSKSVVDEALGALKDVASYACEDEIKGVKALKDKCGNFEQYFEKEVVDESSGGYPIYDWDKQLPAYKKGIQGRSKYETIGFTLIEDEVSFENSINFNLLEVFCRRPNR